MQITLYIPVGYENYYLNFRIKNLQKIGQNFNTFVTICQYFPRKIGKHAKTKIAIVTNCFDKFVSF